VPPVPTSPPVSSETTAFGRRTGARDESREARELAADLVEHLAVTWRSGAPRPWRFADYGRFDEPLDIYAGVAGVVGVLATASTVGGYPAAPAVLAEAATWLTGRHQPAGTRRPGLLVGDAGIAWALGLAAQHHGGSPRAEIMARLSPAPTAGTTPPNDDFLYGTAGAIVAHAGLLQSALAFGLTRDDAAAIRDRLGTLCTGLAIRQAASEVGTGTREGAQREFGFAHGAAGVGYGFLVGGLALGDAELVGHALRYGRVLVEAADRSGDEAWWPTGATRSHQFTANWCNGASGVATFLARLWWFTGEAVALEVARAAARATLAARPGALACTCHGLAGHGELMLDLAAATGEAQYTDAAWSIADQLWAMRARRDGRWLIPDESGVRLGMDHCVDFGVGSSGVAAFLLRLLHGGRRPWMADDVPHGPRAAGFPAFDDERRREVTQRAGQHLLG
jgi:hypothetical protein